MVGSPATSSVQTTLDGGICEVGGSEVHERAPCDEKCWRAVEKRCVCKCGGRNHGAAYRNLSNLDNFSGEADDEMPIVGRDIMSAKMELLWLARKEIIAAYNSIGGLRE